MRYLIAIILFISFGASAQTTYLGGVTTTVLNRGAFVSDSMLAVPKRDTTATFTSQRNTGRITVASDSNIYYHNGSLWKKLSNQSTDTSSLSTRIDARIKYSDTSASWFVTRNYLTVTYLGGTNIATLGTITTGTWNGTVVAGLYGGTGVANSGKTITLGGNISTASSFTTSGANALTLTTTATTNATLPSGTTTLIGSTGGTISSTGLLFSNAVQAKWGGLNAFTIDNSSSTGFCKFNLQTGGYVWKFQYNGTDFWTWYEGGSGLTWRILELKNKGVIQFDVTSGLPSVTANGQIASDGTDLFYYNGTWQRLNSYNNISTTAITGTSNVNLTYDYTTRYVDATIGNIDITIIPTQTGQVCTIKRLDATANTVRVKMNSGNIDGVATNTPTSLQSQYGAISVQWDGTNGLIINNF